MPVRFLIGPAGSGKTFRCLEEIRAELAGAPEGEPLILLAPKQSTYQFERQLLSGGTLAGYTRLQILSFERLAQFVFSQLGQPPPELIDEEGRVMVLRALLGRKRDDLKLFRASARLTGFAQQLSASLTEFQTNQLTPDRIRQIAEQIGHCPALALKLRDLAVLMEEYLAWLKKHQLQDRESLLTAAAEALNARRLKGAERNGTLSRLSVWADGFAELSDNESAFIAALAPWCKKLAVSFCLEHLAPNTGSWLQGWSIPRKAMEKCRQKIAALSSADFSMEILKRSAQNTRFEHSAVLRDLEQNWSQDTPQVGELDASELKRGLRVVICPNLEAEATVAAREILSFVRAGGRYKQVAVLVRNLERYHRTLQRVFSQYEIPCFLDQRRSIAHHPAVELTRSALRTIALGWQHEDWFAALKTGLIPGAEDLDRLENETVARGWSGKAWLQKLPVRDVAQDAADQKRISALEEWLENFRGRIVPPFERLDLQLRQQHQKPTGSELALAIREFWIAASVERQLEEWSLSPEPVHEQESLAAMNRTVWTEINRWLNNLELAFATDALSLRDWLPIVESGLANLTAGIIPPALDQVLVGRIDRSRNPDIDLGLVLGMNEKIFPALPEAGLLLTERDREELGKVRVSMGATAREHLSRERFFAYLGLTRARRRLVLTCAERDSQGAVLYPSPLLERLRQLFPTLPFEKASDRPPLTDCLHECELPNTIRRRRSGQSATWREWSPIVKPCERISKDAAARLYGDVLQTSVSRMEKFAACQFKFFVHSGLRAEERQKFELDVREQGSFQHDVLALFHEELQKEGRKWSDLSPVDARARISAIARALIANYRGGLLEADERTRFMARLLTSSLEDFIEVLVGWMRTQYRFNPTNVELAFGGSDAYPPWRLELGDGRMLELFGRIDRVDLFTTKEGQEALCVVVDYKSSHKKLEPILIEHGLQLQLLAYLNVLKNWGNPQATFGVRRLVPAGVFYVNLRSAGKTAPTRVEALESSEHNRRLGYRHTGRFASLALPYLDSRPDAREGDQFNFRRLKSGGLHGNCREVLESGAFSDLLELVRENLIAMGRAIYAGGAAANPYRKGSAVACDQCDYQSICRIDRWTHAFRVLQPGKQTACQQERGARTAQPESQVV